MNKQDKILGSEKGFVLIASLLVLLILVIIGVAALNTTTIELQIAGNEKVHKETFYAAEAGAELGIEVMMQNLSCPDGFASSGSDSSGVIIDNLDGMTRVYERGGNSLILYQEVSPTIAEVCAVNSISDTSGNFEDIAFPITNLTTGVQASYLYVGGQTEMGFGSSLQMAAAYEGKGKSAAGGGVFKVYDIYSKHEGRNNSQSIVQLGWRCSVDVAGVGDCNY